jgi:purine/pyrimidine-nucleoside phosphorylase
MLKVNEYFDGNVKSIGLTTNDGPATVGVMAAGEYEFGTNTVEHMTVTAGRLLAKNPASEYEWKSYGPGETFIVEKDVKFTVKAVTETAYLCLYK